MIRSRPQVPAAPHRASLASHWQGPNLLSRACVAIFSALLKLRHSFAMQGTLGRYPSWPSVVFHYAGTPLRADSALVSSVSVPSCRLQRPVTTLWPHNRAYCSLPRPLPLVLTLAYGRLTAARLPNRQG